MIHVQDGLFALHTDHTSYLFRLLPTGHPEHLYYGPAIPDPVERGQQTTNPNGCTVVYSPDAPTLCLDDIALESGGPGVGDTRQPLVELVFPDGSRTCDFTLDRYEVLDAPRPLNGLPSAHGGGQSLVLTLREAARPVALELHYTVYPDCDCITRSAVLVNLGAQPVQVERLMSAQLDLEGTGYRFTCFQGSWAREMSRVDTLLPGGRVENGSLTGFSSNKANPFVMISAPAATETTGQVIGSNLIYSGSHLEQLEAFPTGRTRFLTGINPQQFSWCLGPGEQLESPQAVFAFSDSGFRGISLAMHRFVREHIVAPQWQNRPRPVLLNSWEACYFSIDEDRLCSLAQAAREVGVELLVMDDGWFGHRNDDTSSLGDWFPNRSKLPHGLKGVADRVRELGLDFGVWVEPEMVNEDSLLYREHPDWAVQIPGRPQSLSRNQMLLDLTRPQVQDWLIDTMSGVFSSADIRYVKWDMNRDFSHTFSQALPAERQGEFVHRFILGVYRVMDALTRAFPDILFEGCASGGNRFDLGILRYFPQIWGSDNTDALTRVTIQNGYSYGYPQSVLGCHVSGVPNHQTLRTVPVSTRFNVAAFGLLGYEYDLAALSQTEREDIKEQIAFYKAHRELFQFGQLYRIGGRLMGERADFGTADRDLARWMVVSPDRTQAAALTVQGLAEANQSHAVLRCAGLDPRRRYRFTNRVEKIPLERLGGMAEAFASTRGRDPSRRMDSEAEDFTATGQQLCTAGVPLAQSFASDGFNPNTRLYQDCDSRLYLLEAVEE